MSDQKSKNADLPIRLLLYPEARVFNIRVISGCPVGTSDLECTGNGKFLYFSFFSTQKSSIHTGNHAISCNFGLK